MCVGWAYSRLDKAEEISTEVIHGSETKQADSYTQRPKGWLPQGGVGRMREKE